MPRSTIVRIGAYFVVAVMLFSSLAVVAAATHLPSSSPRSPVTALARPGTENPQPFTSYGITFSESGLPANLLWTVSIVGHGTSSLTTDGSTDSLGFFEPNGVYSYTVTDISGWHQTTLPYHGSLTVSGGPVTEPTLAYVQVTYSVTFAESGLPSGQTFEVSVNGTPQSLTTDGSTDSLVFTAPNGTFSYAVQDVSGWHQATLPYLGAITVTGGALTKPTLVFTQVTYSVTFSESGLPSGHTFGVTVNAIPKSLTTNGGTDSLSWGGLPNGSYPYAIADIAGWQQSTLPSHGSVVVAGASVTEPTLIYTKTTFSVVFSESGLPPGETFQVTVGRGVESLISDGETDSLLFTETNGSYPYAVDGISGWHQTTLAYSGSLMVNGSGVDEPTLLYFQVTYSVMYTESGLPPGTTWSLTLDGVLETSTSPSISFTEPNGSYSYKVGYVAGYATDPSFPTSGTQPVSGGDLSVAVPFVQVTYAVTFTESGLPPGTTWSVMIGAQSVSSTSTTVVFELPNGTFDYVVPAVPGYTPVLGSGSVTVANATVGVSAPFSLVTYTVTFTESGLPATHPKPWSVAFGGSIETTTGTSIHFSVGNSTDTYLIQGPAGYRVSSVLPPQGTIVVNGASIVQPVTFLKGSTGTIAFHESGLGPATTWCVTLGAAACSTGPKILARNLTPGTYSYSVRSVIGMTILVQLGHVALGQSGSIALAHSASVQVRFTYGVTFTETGLPGGTAWKVTAGGASITSTGSTIVLYLKNGTYTFHVTRVTGHVASPGSGAVRVAGGPLSVSIRFTASPH